MQWGLYLTSVWVLMDKSSAVQNEPIRMWTPHLSPCEAPIKPPACSWKSAAVLLPTASFPPWEERIQASRLPWAMVFLNKESHFFVVVVVTTISPAFPIPGLSCADEYSILLSFCVPMTSYKDLLSRRQETPILHFVFQEWLFSETGLRPGFAFVLFIQLEKHLLQVSFKDVSSNLEFPQMSRPTHTAEWRISIQTQIFPELLRIVSRLPHLQTLQSAL